MSNPTFGENDLLEYNPSYKILICRKCQYAIQKNAIDSHLLRHKIYRGERQNLLSAITRLDLLEPENVPLPPPESPPVDALPVLSGFCCTASGCLHLTASSKRMRRHWSESHGLDGSVPFSPSLARKVKLQTFFRGTKVRYFEVTSSSLSISACDDVESSGNDDHEMPEDDVPSSRAALLPLPSQHSPSPGGSATSTNPADFNLETLFYFHHFMTITSRTLPAPVPVQYVKNYWQMLAIPAALAWRWLVCGLLAVSAHHLAVLADDATIRQLHQNRMSQFSAQFNTGFEQMTARAFDPEAPAVDSDAQQVARQFKNLLECARWTLPVLTYVGSLGVSTPLHVIMSIVRGCEIPEVSPHAMIPDFDMSSGTAHDQLYTQNVMYGGNMSPLHGNQSGDNNQTPSMIVSRLQMLPARIAERMERPDRGEEIMAVLTATRIMLKSCEISFASDDSSVVWQGAVSWLAKVPNDFNHMASQRHPAAVVLLAYWAAILVKRAAEGGCWHLRGLVNEIMLQVSKEFSRNNCTSMDLVVDIADVMNVRT